LFLKSAGYLSVIVSVAQRLFIFGDRINIRSYKGRLFSGGHLEQ